MLQEYTKIETMFVRDTTTKKLDESEYINNTVEYLKDNIWQFTEKIDGTNVRIYWDGHKVSYYGRTNNSQVPADILNLLVELFGGEDNAQIFEQKFGDIEVMLIGEGYGGNIQKGTNYSKVGKFILFDVKIGENYQNRNNVETIARYFNLDVVPVVLEGTLQEGVDYIKTKPKSTIGEAMMEGLVARPKIELNTRDGKRVIVKIKVRDFK